MEKIKRFESVGKANEYARNLYERKVTSYVRQDDRGYYVELA